MREVTLTSGAVLKVGPSPFAAAKALYQAVLSEFGAIKLDPNLDVEYIFKDIFCVGFSSPKIEACLWKCMERCLYCDARGELKITADTFEPTEARSDYMKVCMEVAKENIGPFVKSLFAEYKTISATLAVTLKSQPMTTSS